MKYRINRSVPILYLPSLLTRFSEGAMEVISKGVATSAWFEIYPFDGGWSFL